MLSMFSLEGKNALVIGGSRGLGKGIAKALADAGAVVAVSSRKQGDCTKAAEEIRAAGGHDAYGIAGDISTTEGVETLIQKAILTLDHIDILVNSAGINIRQPALEYTEEAWDQIQDIQLKGVFFTCQAVARHMVEKGIRGRIINISSVNAQVIARPHIVSYVAAKAGVRQMTKALALEWAPYGITVNAIGPGWFKTEITKALFEDEATRNEILAHIPMKHPGNPEKDLGGMAVYYASDASAYTTGQFLCIDGGYTCI